MKNRKHFSIFQDNFLELFSTFREIKQQENEKKHKNGQKSLSETNEMLAKQSRMPPFQNIDAFYACPYFCPPLQATSSLFHVPFSLAMQRSILSSVILFFMPTKSEYFSNRLSFLTQLKDSLLFSFKKGLDMFVLIEGALLHYDLHGNDMCKPKHVIMIQHNTNLRVLDRVRNSGWILEVSGLIETSNKCLSEKDDSSFSVSALNAPSLDISLRNSKQKEVILFNMTTQESLSEWHKMLHREIFKCKQRLLSNQDSQNDVFNTNSHSASGSLPMNVYKKKKPTIPMRPSLSISHNFKSTIEKKHANHEETDQLNNHNCESNRFCEKIDEEIIDTLKMFNLMMDETRQKNQNTTTTKEPSILSFFIPSDMPDTLNNSLSEISDSKKSRAFSYTSSISIPTDAQERRVKYNSA
ncbi:hypothetical protein PORY_002541 [Pneumocystis oryctolagi]|uniref:Uncharacterized protein n=1 Tax=Pneumocystis oryctolagi TaxID=42067 RepID=A0ACB7C905_9ASCO|nr:hypothetical protein PORY_002541 [Pneumocystis oryctolagi]